MNTLLFQVFIRFILEFLHILPYTTELALAISLVQANVCLKGEIHSAAVIIAADCLNDGSLQTSQIAAESLIPATDPTLPGLLFSLRGSFLVTVLASIFDYIDPQAMIQQKA